MLDTNARVVPVQTVYVNASYRKDSNENDINLVILAQAANVAHTLIATPAQLLAAQAIQLVGFGYNDPSRRAGFGTKRQVSVSMAPLLQAAAGESLEDLEAQLGFHSDYEFVAGRKGLGVDTCNGDSGGPAYMRLDNGTYVLAGLTSRATRNSVLACGDGGVYVRPDKFVAWIDEKLKIAGLPTLS